MHSLLRRGMRIAVCGTLAWSAGAAGAGTQTIKASFACEAGKKIQAVFVNGDKPSVRLLLSDGRELTLPQVLSGSGARYANADESFVFWNKGRTAFIQEQGKTSYSNCQQDLP
jgi:membrane-bound inhibitor of C-type lysozyme